MITRRFSMKTIQDVVIQKINKMKAVALKTFIKAFLLSMIMVSCAKNNLNSRGYLNEVSGTYKGQFISTDTNYQGIQATADISKTENDQLLIHCYGNPIDTSFLLDAFENGDSVMVCETGNDFYHEYGHSGNGYHMMDMRMGESEWMHHLHDNHQPGDIHYGGFDLKHHSFNYRLKIKNGIDYEFVEFNGSLQK